MSRVNDYRRAMAGLRPSTGWRARTLAAMEKAAAGARRARPVRHPLRRAAVAAVLVAAFVGAVWWNLPWQGTAAPIHTPGVARTPAPDCTPSVDVWSLSDAGGWITIVEDPAQQMGSNPTQGRLDELTELPVYYNQKPTEGQQTARVEALAGELGLTITSSRWHEGTAEPSQGWSPSLWADCADGSTLRLYGLYSLNLLGDAPPPEALYGLYDTAADPALWSTETAEAYSYDGTQSISRIWFYDDPGASLEQQLYNYSFLRFSITDSGSAQMTLPPAGEGTAYPIRTAEEAVALFRSGDYWSTMETAYPERAEILQITLEYAAQGYQEYIQPVYRILFTQDYWDAYLAEWMGDEADASRFTGVAAAYVPAVDGLDFRMYANDTDLHRTPS